jgi:transcription antitermination factor NusG
MNERWVLARCKTRQERRAIDNLERQVCVTEVYAPRYSEQGKPHILFPGYLFVRTAAVNLSWLRSTKGMLDAVRMGSDYVIVRDDLVRSIRGREDADGWVKLPPPLEPGDLVTTRRGLFAGHVGLYEGMLAHNRVRVLFHVLGRQTRVEVDRDALERAA